ncbi:MAG: hypothetical protein ACLFUJ_15245 [Phycisphaerae bacterium]
MQNNSRTVRVRVDNFTRCMLAILAALLVVLIAGLWVYAVPDAPAAEAQFKTNTEGGTSFANAIAQRKALIDAQNETNKKLTELIAVLKSGQVEVKVSSPDASGKAGPQRGTP